MRHTKEERGEHWNGIDSDSKTLRSVKRHVDVKAFNRLRSKLSLQIQIAEELAHNPVHVLTPAIE